MLLVGRRGSAATVCPLFLVHKDTLGFTLWVRGLLFHGIRHLWGVVDDLRNPSNYESYIKPKGC